MLSSRLLNPPPYLSPCCSALSTPERFQLRLIPQLLAPPCRCLASLQVLATMTQLNSVGEQLGSQPAVHAMTDVTGFGLCGHLLEVCRGSGLGAVVTFNKVREAAGGGDKGGASNGCGWLLTELMWVGHSAQMVPVARVS